MQVQELVGIVPWTFIAQICNLFIQMHLSQIPILDVGVPAVLSVYFDWFSGVMQAFIFCMLTVMYIANAAEEG